MESSPNAAAPSDAVGDWQVHGAGTLETDEGNLRAIALAGQSLILGRSLAAPGEVVRAELSWAARRQSGAEDDCRVTLRWGWRRATVTIGFSDVRIGLTSAPVAPQAYPLSEQPGGWHEYRLSLDATGATLSVDDRGAIDIPFSVDAEATDDSIEAQIGLWDDSGADSEASWRDLRLRAYVSGGGREADVSPDEGGKLADLVAAAEQSLKQGSLDQAISICRHGLDREAHGQDPAVRRLTELLEQAQTAKRRGSGAIHVVILGDSLSFPRPFEARSYHPRRSPRLATTAAQTYPILLRRLLATAYPECDSVVTNLGRSSDGLREVLTQAYVGFFYYDPNVVVLHVGIVDCWPRGTDLWSGNLSKAQFANAFQRFLEIRREYCAEKLMVVVGISPTDPRTREKIPGIADVIRGYNGILRECQDRTTFFIDPADYYDERDPYRLLHLDGQHLSANGHTLLAEALSGVIRREVPSAR